MLAQVGVTALIFSLWLPLSASLFPPVGHLPVGELEEELRELDLEMGLEVPMPVRVPIFQRRAVRLERLLKGAKHQLTWTGAHFVCKSCKASRGPTRLGTWLHQGVCRGSCAAAAQRKHIKAKEKRFSPSADISSFTQSGSEALPDSEGQAHHEWDVSRGAYRIAAVRVLSPPSSTGPLENYQRICEQQRREIATVRRRFAALRVEERWIGRQPDGPELDLSAAIRAQGGGGLPSVGNAKSLGWPGRAALGQRGGRGQVGGDRFRPVSA